jgi:hypothetical protein
MSLNKKVLREIAVARSDAAFDGRTFDAGLLSTTRAF